MYVLVRVSLGIRHGSIYNTSYISLAHITFICTCIYTLSVNVFLPLFSYLCNPIDFTLQNKTIILLETNHLKSISKVIYFVIIISIVSMA